jgi:lipopolysaccharide/colanic/teichoic acid biosynthesis glycosyltransferase
MRASNEAKVLERGRFGSTVKSQPSKGEWIYLISKRTFDVAASFAGIIFCLPVFFIISLWIKIEDPKGSVFFKQLRVGKDGKQFYMYKFRSMVSNAEELLKDLLDKNEVSGLMFKMKEDPRITKVGRFIRRTSLDELPQLWNVLIGEMSLVGPRPPLPREVEGYSSYHMKRLAVTPGCTGLWQVSARNSVGFEKMVELDLDYIKKRNFSYDFRILLKTVALLISMKDAY